jgi:hypothetical protein
LYRSPRCIAANALAANIAARLFTFDLLDCLGYSYLEYTIVTFGSALTQTLVSPW